MNFISSAYFLVFYQPLLNALVALYYFLPGHDFGIAIIILTFLIRLALAPLVAHSIRAQKVLMSLQQKTEEIQVRFKNDKEKQLKEIAELYKKEKVNPLGGLLPVIIQLPILFALYQVFWKGFRLDEMANLYAFVPRPETINPFFLGIVNLSQPNAVLVILAGILQFYQSKMLIGQRKDEKPKNDRAEQISSLIQKQTTYFLPVFTAFIFWKLPSALALYLVITTGFSIVQQYIVLRKKDVQPGAIA